MKKLILTMALLSNYALAAEFEIWRGSGSLFSLDGQVESLYELTVKNSKNGVQTQSEIIVTLPDGSIHKEQCQSTYNNNHGWSAQCSIGHGGGRCFGEGLCISYLADNSGKAYATTIVFDDSSNMRLLRTELYNGQAVRFFREKLHKEQK